MMTDRAAVSASECGAVQCCSHQSARWRGLSPLSPPLSVPGVSCLSTVFSLHLKNYKSHKKYKATMLE